MFSEFIIISRNNIKEATAEYAIRVDKYAEIRKQLNKGRYEAEELEKVGGFKINESLRPEEISAHDGWKELAVGKNNASDQDHEEASKFLDEYILKAQQDKCFLDGTGMEFFVNTNENNKVRHWFVFDSSDKSYAFGRGDFDDDGCFLKLAPKMLYKI